MLSWLVPKLLPRSLSDLFSPPLDSSKLHLSLSQGVVQLADLAFNANHINQEILSPISPIHIRRGSLVGVSVELDWMRLFTQPISVRAKGIHIVLTRNTLDEKTTPTSTSSEKGKIDETQKQTATTQQHATPQLHTATDASPSLPRAPSSLSGAGDHPHRLDETTELKSNMAEATDVASTPTTTTSSQQRSTSESAIAAPHTESGRVEPSVSVNDAKLLESAISVKLAALSQCHLPNGLHFGMRPQDQFDPNFIVTSNTTKRMIALLIRALHITAKEITIEYEHEIDDDKHKSHQGEKQMTGTDESTTGGTTESEERQQQIMDDVTGRMSDVAIRHDEPTTGSIPSTGTHPSQPATVGTTDVTGRAHEDELVRSSRSVHVGLSIDECRFQSFESTPKQLGLPGHMSMVKSLDLTGLSMWCDDPNGDRRHIDIDDVAIGSTQPDWSKPDIIDDESATRPSSGSAEGKSTMTSTEQEVAHPTSDIETPSTTAPSTESSTTGGVGVRHRHSYLLHPISTSFHIATNSELNSSLDLMLRWLSSSSSSFVTMKPNQFRSIVSIVTSMQRHMQNAYHQLESVASRHFRSLTPNERNEYVRLYSIIQKTSATSREGGPTVIAGGDPLSSSDRAEFDRFEREGTFAELIQLRTRTFTFHPAAPTDVHPLHYDTDATITPIRSTPDDSSQPSSASSIHRPSDDTLSSHTDDDVFSRVSRHFLSQLGLFDDSRHVDMTKGSGEATSIDSQQRRDISEGAIPGGEVEMKQQH